MIFQHVDALILGRKTVSEIEDGDEVGADRIDSRSPYLLMMLTSVPEVLDISICTATRLNYLSVGILV